MLTKRPSILAFPKVGIPYNECLYRELERRGACVEDGTFAGRWLLENAKRFDCVHVHWPSFFYNGRDENYADLLRGLARFVLLFSLLRASGLKVIWTAHNLYPHDRAALPVIDKLARRFIIAIASRVLVHGPTGAAILEKEFPSVKGKTVVVEHGHWVDYYPKGCTKSEARDRLGLRQDELVYLFIGLCKEYKNLHGLIEAFTQLPGAPRLLIVGRFQSDAYRERIEALARARSPSRIHLESRYVPDAELQYYLAACDIVALPYTEILTSGAAMLAISFGRPVVAPRQGYLVDAISEECGVLYDPGADQGLATALQEAAGATFDEAAIVRRALGFNWGTAAAAILDAMA